VLVAVSIPIFTAQLEKSREATDLANQRACKAEVVASLLAPSSTFDKDGDGIMDAGDYYYNAETGTLDAKAPTTGYGKGTTTEGNSGNTQDNYNPKASYTGGYLKVTIAANSNKATIAWDNCDAKTTFSVGE
jgi:hypothetical protein